MNAEAARQRSVSSVGMQIFELSQKCQKAISEESGKGETSAVVNLNNTTEEIAKQVIAVLEVLGFRCQLTNQHNSTGFPRDQSFVIDWSTPPTTEEGGSS